MRKQEKPQLRREDERKLRGHFVKTARRFPFTRAFLVRSNQLDRLGRYT